MCTSLADAIGGVDMARAALDVLAKLLALMPSAASGATTDSFRQRGVCEGQPLAARLNPSKNFVDLTSSRGLMTESAFAVLFTSA